MWRSQIFWRLFGAYCFLLAISLGVLGWVIIRRIETRLIADVRHGLEAKTLLVAEIAARLPASEMQDAIVRLAHEINVRVTLIGSDGVHLSGGGEMIRAATNAKKGDMSILGVTVLTSSTDATLREIGINAKADEQVLRLARLGVQHGIDGIVASAHEIKPLRAEFGDKIKIVVPGIRPIGTEAGDQKRTMSPREAIDAGADYLVIGRPIIAHKDPRDALKKILQELE